MLLAKLFLVSLLGTMAFSKEVNIYTHRHYDVDKQIFKKFTEKTGIKVNVIKGQYSGLIERIKSEGKNTKADILITVDAGRLYIAKSNNLLQSISSNTLTKNIPEHLRDKDNQWFGLTKRARVIVYSKDRVKKEDLKRIKDYEDLTNPKWKGKVLIRSSNNIYNQSLLGSIIEHDGENKALEWAKGVVANMARVPKGNDRDQAKAIVAEIGDVAVLNTYYIGKMSASKSASERDVVGHIGIIFPNQDNRGSHVNVSGAGVTKYAKNKENAIKLLEFLVSKDIQNMYAKANFEYPIRKDVQPADIIKSWGDFKEDKLSLNRLGENNKKAVEIFDKASWR